MWTSCVSKLWEPLLKLLVTRCWRHATTKVHVKPTHVPEETCRHQCRCLPKVWVERLKWILTGFIWSRNSCVCGVFCFLFPWGLRHSLSEVSNLVPWILDLLLTQCHLKKPQKWCGHLGFFPCHRPTELSNTDQTVAIPVSNKIYVGRRWSVCSMLLSVTGRALVEHW